MLVLAMCREQHTWRWRCTACTWMSAFWHSWTVLLVLYILRPCLGRTSRNGQCPIHSPCSGVGPGLLSFRHIATTQTVTHFKCLGDYEALRSKESPGQLSDWCHWRADLILKGHIHLSGMVVPEAMDAAFQYQLSPPIAPVGQLARTLFDLGASSRQ